MSTSAPAAVNKRQQCTGQVFGRSPRTHFFFFVEFHFSTEMLPTGCCVPQVQGQSHPSKFGIFNNMWAHVLEKNRLLHLNGTSCLKDQRALEAASFPSFPASPHNSWVTWKSIWSAALSLSMFQSFSICCGVKMNELGPAEWVTATRFKQGNIQIFSLFVQIKTKCTDKYLKSCFVMWDEISKKTTAILC